MVNLTSGRGRGQTKARHERLRDSQKMRHLRSFEHRGTPVITQGVRRAKIRDGAQFKTPDTRSQRERDWTYAKEREDSMG